MASSVFNIVLTLSGFFIFFVVFVKSSEDKNCVCPGPTRYYRELGCTPVFNSSESCCPTRYNCDHLKNLPPGKCYINGHIYGSNQRVKSEDIVSPCPSCRCSGGRFWCATPSCAGPRRPSCYMKKTPFQCCGHEFCPEKGAVIPTCIVDGKTYKDGEFFIPSAEPEKRCYCGEGYTGANVAPFCRSPERTSCSNLLHHFHNIRANCVPYYSFTASLENDCNSYFRCQFDSDVVIRPNEGSALQTSESEDPDMMCSFGNLRMRIGDELNENANYHATCMKCVCEVPPIPTCRRRSPEECKHLNNRRK